MAALGQFFDLRWGLVKKEGGSVFEGGGEGGGDTPLHTMMYFQLLLVLQIL